MAKLCKQYDIPIAADRVFTHYELGKATPGTQNAGKIDINFLPWDLSVKESEVGPLIRSKVKWYFEKLQTPSTVKPVVDNPVKKPDFTKLKGLLIQVLDEVDRLSNG